MLSISLKLTILKLLNVNKNVRANFSKLSIEIRRIVGQLQEGHDAPGVAHLSFPDCVA